MTTTFTVQDYSGSTAASTTFDNDLIISNPCIDTNYVTIAATNVPLEAETYDIYSDSIGID